jgi:hypothetical protein
MLVSDTKTSIGEVAGGRPKATEGE